MRRHGKASSAGTNRRRRIFGAIGMAAVLVLVLAVAPASAVAPTVSIDAPTDVSYTSAKLSGELDPGDNDTNYSFEYAIAGSGSWSGFQSLGPIPANSGNQALPPRELTELQPGTEYEARLAANNFIDPEVLSAEPNPTFTTDPVAAPGVSIDPVTAITGDSAHFEGTIEPGTPAGSPEAFKVNWRFECTPACPGLKGGTIEAESTCAKGAPRLRSPPPSAPGPIAGQRRKPALPAPPRMARLPSSPPSSSSPTATTMERLTFTATRPAAGPSRGSPPPSQRDTPARG